MRQPTNGILRILGILMLLFVMQDALSLAMVCYAMFQQQVFDLAVILMVITLGGYVISHIVSAIFAILYFSNAEKIRRCIYSGASIIVFCVLYLAVASVFSAEPIAATTLLMTAVSKLLIPAVFIYVSVTTRKQLLRA